MRFGENGTEVPMETSQKGASRLHEKVVDRNYVESDVGVVPGLYLAMHHINGVRCLPLYETTESERLLCMRKNNVELFKHDLHKVHLISGLPVLWASWVCVPLMLVGVLIATTVVPFISNYHQNFKKIITFYSSL